MNPFLASGREVIRMRMAAVDAPEVSDEQNAVTSGL